MDKIQEFMDPIKRWCAWKREQALAESEPDENINFSLLMPRGVIARMDRAR
jgi:hypothetical protein